MKNHSCVGDLPFSVYGEAIKRCFEFRGFLIVDNDEYESTVNYCPFCGYKAKKQVRIKNYVKGATK